MKIYLMRHGEAEALSLKDEPQLTEKGKLTITKLAQFLQPKKITVNNVFHSDKKRAIETAEIMLTSIHALESPEVCKELGPNEPISPMFTRVTQTIDQDVMLIGHLPFMGRFANFLLANNEDSEGIAFAPGTLLCFESRTYTDNFQLIWMINPNHLL